MQRLSKLQKEHVALEGRHEQLTTELRQAQSDKENLHDELTRAKDLPLLLKVSQHSLYCSICSIWLVQPSINVQHKCITASVLK